MRGHQGIARSGRLLLAGFVVAGLSALPFQLQWDLTIDPSSALAKGNDKGGGNDNGGGSDKGGGNDKGGGKGSDKSGPGGNSASAAGHNKSETGPAASNAGLGSLNASNASPTARANASRNSPVGQLGDYENALAAGDLAAAAAALASAANKEISTETVAAVNRNMDIESTPEEEAEVAALAEAARTAELGETEDEPGEEQVTDGSSDDAASTKAEDGAITAAAEELLGKSKAETTAQ